MLRSLPIVATPLVMREIYKDENDMYYDSLKR